jgi:magnesium-transporting ATPase (P-type)
MDTRIDEGVWHDRTADEALAALRSFAGGLTATEVEQRLREHGANRLPEPPGVGWPKRFVRQFHNILIYVLLVAALIAASLQHYVDASVIAAVVVANAVIGFVQEGKAERAMDAIRDMLAPRASVRRDGERVTVPGESLVPGDIVLLAAGDRVAADLRLLACRGLQIQESILTGESVPVEKTPGAVSSDASLGDRSCMAFSGTLVTAGQGSGVVIATGERTEIGRISGMLASVRMLTTPLVKQMSSFARWLTGLILLLAVLVMLYGSVFMGYPFSDMFMAVVGLSVAAIPEGLPAVLTITLAVGVQAMARRHAIVRRLPAIETLGSVSVICSDKTGTLTRNEMMASSVCVGGALFRVEGAGYEPRGEIRPESGDGSSGVDAGSLPGVFVELARCVALCNDASLRRAGEEWATEGEPMEGALLALAGKAGVDPSSDLAGWTRTDTIPFDSRHRFMATLHHDHHGNASIAVKGAPERVIMMCDRERLTDGGTAPLDRDAWHKRAESIASQGQRTLAIASRPAPIERTVLDADDLESGLILLGLIGIIDPPRPEAIDAVRECHAAGIQVKMITGDHAGTAAAIGRQIGLRETSRVLTGAEVESMDDASLTREVARTDIFARTSPEHKLRLVMALQERGMTVAMTGDGVNDAPALKRADAGIAMGLSGSEAAKEAAEFVLADDNFASIVAAVREGRTVYANIKKVISWTLPTNGGEALTILIALLFGMTLPITPVQILWVNMITAVTLGLALAFEPTEESAMRRPPRPRDEPILTAGLVWRVVFVSVLFVFGVFGVFAYAMNRGYPVELARTLAVNALVVMEIFNLFFIRNMNERTLRWEKVRGTRVVWLTVGLVTAAQFAMTYFPPMQSVFQTRAVPLLDGLLVVGLGVMLLVVVETEKQVRLRVRGTRPVEAELGPGEGTRAA